MLGLLRVAGGMLVGLAALLAGCAVEPPAEPGIGKPVAWSSLSGWQEDRLNEAWPALLAQCPRLARENLAWAGICAAASAVNATDANAIRAFIEQHFQPHEVLGSGGTRNGLITGYYQPILKGSRNPSERFRYPLYARPNDLLTVELSSLFPELQGKRVRGRLEGNKVVPYYPRAEIDGAAAPLRGHELLWIDDPHGSFFLQIQGSGRVELEDGTLVGVNYADQNGHPYVAIGKKLIEMGALGADEVSLFTIRAWLREHPERAPELLAENPSYVFFTLRENVAENPRGSLNVPLTDERSIAVDRKVIALGSPVWLDTQLPLDQTPYRRLMLAQDTGGAISGPVRADVYFGTGPRAEQLAGHMKARGQLYVLVPRAAAAGS
ncbi:MAG: murein transglycosylase A [Thiotrichales bacterium]